MRRVSQEALAGFQIQRRLHVQVLGQRVGPEFSLQINRDEIAVAVGANNQIAGGDSRLENLDGLFQFLLQLCHVRSGQSAKLFGPKVDDRLVRVFVVLQVKRLQSAEGKIGLRIEQPLEVAQYSAPILLM